MANDLDPLRNIKDPLHKTGPDQQKELFRKMSAVASGFSAEDVIGAAVNILLNAVRQSYSRRNVAEARFDELFGRTKATLLSHYDGAGNRRNVFPYDQVINMETFVDMNN